MRHVVVLLVTLALALVGPLVPVALTAHGEWQDHYTDATGVNGWQYAH